MHSSILFYMYTKAMMQAFFGIFCLLSQSYLQKARQLFVRPQKALTLISPVSLDLKTVVTMSCGKSMVTRDLIITDSPRSR